MAIHRLRLVVAQMLTTAKMAVARKKAKRRSQRVVNDIHRAHRAVTVANQVIRVVVNRQVVATHRLHQVNSMNHAHNQYLVHLSRVCYTHFTIQRKPNLTNFIPFHFIVNARATFGNQNAIDAPIIRPFHSILETLFYLFFF